MSATIPAPRCRRHLTYLLASCDTCCPKRTQVVDAPLDVVIAEEIARWQPTLDWLAER